MKKFLSKWLSKLISFFISLLTKFKMFLERKRQSPIAFDESILEAMLERHFPHDGKMKSSITSLSKKFGKGYRLDIVNLTCHAGRKGVLQDILLTLEAFPVEKKKELPFLLFSLYKGIYP